MIVLEDKKLVIITPPHTASGNLHRALCGTEFGGAWAIGPTPDGAGYDHHVTKIAEGWKDFTVAMVVRHPLDRMIGLYDHHLELSRRSGWNEIPWWLFVAQAISRHPDLSWFYRTTISELSRGVDVDVILEFESLAVDLEEKLGLKVSMPHGWTQERSWESFYAQAGPCCQVEWWASEDMQNYGYSSRLS